MTILISDVRDTDLPEVLELNESEVPHVGTIDMQQLRWFAANADYFRTARDGARLAGFLIGLRPGSDYGSPNYRWFCEHLDDFGYVDRVAVSTEYRRSGLASRLYADFAEAMAGVPALTCEVNIDPPNDASMRFHRSLGFDRVGTLTSADGDKEVALLSLTRSGPCST
jgi:predicted GNAT superfamily acetyltransferase